MPMSYRYPSGYNPFVAEATGQVIAFVRDPKKYKYNQYVQIVPTETTVGLYYKMHVDDVMRLNNLNDTVWADGMKRPQNTRGDGIRFVPAEFFTTRHNFDFTIGWKAQEMGMRSGLKFLLAYTTLMRNKAQMHRTQRIITTLETAANWGSSNTASASALGGNSWDKASSDPTSVYYLAIKKTLDAVALQIHLKTNGLVGEWDEGEDSGLRLIVSPGTAQKMSQSDEIHNYLRQSPFALAQVQGKKPGQNAKWGLPDQLYGWELIVENAVRVFDNPIDGNTEAPLGGPGGAAAGTGKQFIKTDDNAIVTTRIGGLDGDGTPNASTIQMYYLKKEMDVEVFDEPKHRYSDGNVVIDDVVVLAAAASGFLITDVRSDV